VSRTPQSADAARVFGVGELTRWIADTLDGLPPVWVAGTLSNVRRWSSGHCYFSLTDPEQDAVLNAVTFRREVNRLKFEPDDGLEVIAFGEVNVYAPRGNYQLIVSAMEPKGESAAQIAMRKLLEQLKQEGVLDPDRKRAIPLWPRRVALITSPQSAAAADLRRVLRRRWPAAGVWIAPTLVQGENAPEQIVDAFQRVADFGHAAGAFDVVVAGRGGGSAEDLSAWNDERVARAILACPFPVISAVGHEIDVSVADLVADLRAATPSEAAELAVPDQWEIRERVDDLQHQLLRAMRGQIEAQQNHLDALARSWGLRHPRERLQAQMQRTDDLGERLSTALRVQMAHAAQQVGGLAPRLHQAAAANVHDARYRVGGVAGRLDSLSPLKVLGRGYSLVQTPEDGKAVVDPAQAPAGTPLRIRTAGGALRATSDGAEE